MTIDSAKTRRSFEAGGKSYDYYSLPAAEELGLAGVARLPVSLKVVLENLLRQHAEGRSDGKDIAALAGWLAQRHSEHEIDFLFSRVVMPDSSGVPMLGDLAAVRDAMVRLGGDPKRLNPSVPIDLVVDHSVMVDESGSAGALGRNLALEFKRNAERYAMLRWAEQAFDNVRIVPPGSGIIHQVNLEYLAQVVCSGSVGRPRHRLSRFGAGDGQPHADDQRARHPGLGRRRPGGRRRRAGRDHLDADPRSSRLQDHRQAQARRHLHRPGADHHASDAPPQAGRQVHRILRPRRRRADPAGPRDHRQHDPGERRHHGLFPGRCRDPALPAPDRARRSPRGAGRGVLQGAGHVARRGVAAGRLQRSHRNRPVGGRAQRLRAQPAAGARGARRGAGRISQRIPEPQAGAAIGWAAPQGRRRRHRRDHQLHQHLQSLGDDRRGPLGAQRAGARLDYAALGQDFAFARLARRRRLPGAKRAAGIAGRAGLSARRLRLHDLHGQFRAAAGGDQPGDRSRRPYHRRGAVGQPQFRGPHPSGGARQLPGFAAAGGGLRAGGQHPHRPRHAAAGPRPHGQAGLPARHLARRRGNPRDDRYGAHAGAVSRELCRRSRGHAGMARAARRHRHPVSMAARQHLHPPPAVPRRHGGRSCADGRHPRCARARPVRRHVHHRPYFADRHDLGAHPGGRLPGFAGRGPRRFRQLRARAGSTTT